MCARPDAGQGCRPRGPAGRGAPPRTELLPVGRPVEPLPERVRDTDDRSGGSEPGTMLQPGRVSAASVLRGRGPGRRHGRPGTAAGTGRGATPAGPSASPRARTTARSSAATGHGRRADLAVRRPGRVPDAAACAPGTGCTSTGQPLAGRRLHRARRAARAWWPTASPTPSSRACWSRTSATRPSTCATTSTDNVVQDNEIRRTGPAQRQVRRGRLHRHGAEQLVHDQRLPARPAATRNVVQRNDIAGTTAESVDIKEGTSEAWCGTTSSTVPTWSAPTRGST